MKHYSNFRFTISLQSDKIVKGAKLGNPQFNYNWDIQNWEIK